MRFLALLSTSLLTASPLVGQVVLTNNGQAFTAIDRDWTKPHRRNSVIKVKNPSESCGALGYGNDPNTFRWKNRADTPSTTHLVTVDAIRDLPDRPLWTRGRTRENWKAADRKDVWPYEGIPVTVEGYFEIVKPGSKEGTNCDGTAERDTDWHIALVANTNEREEQSVVVEPTPRGKRREGWTLEKAQSIAIREKPSSTRQPARARRVRVSGFLMLDPYHWDHIRAACDAAPNCNATRFFRATLWEVHPVTRIEVWDGSAWVELMDFQP